MNKIYTVIKIYIISFILCFWSRLHSDKLPLPGLGHPAVLFNLLPCYSSAFSVRRFSAISEPSSTWANLRCVQTCSLKKMWHTWGNIDESGPLAWANGCVSTAKTIRTACYEEKVWCVCLLTYRIRPSLHPVNMCRHARPTSRGTRARRLNATSSGCAKITVQHEVKSLSDRPFHPPLARMGKWW